MPKNNKDNLINQISKIEKDFDNNIDKSAIGKTEKVSAEEIKLLADFCSKVARVSVNTNKPDKKSFDEAMMRFDNKIKLTERGFDTKNFVEATLQCKSTNYPELKPLLDQLRTQSVSPAAAPAKQQKQSRSR